MLTDADCRNAICPAGMSKRRLTDSGGSDFLSGFDWPAPGIESGIFGSQRIDNGTPMSPHYGVDMAALRRKSLSLSEEERSAQGTLDAKAKTTPELVEQVKNGVAALDGELHVPFLELSSGYQLEALQRIEQTPFFGTVRSHTVVALYNNQVLWADFGYQGSSWQDGGYLQRGFQDVGWTLQPDAEASPPPFLG